MCLFYYLFNLFSVGRSLARLSGILLKATRRCLLLQKSSDGNNIFKKWSSNFRAWRSWRDTLPSARSETVLLKAAVSTKTMQSLPMEVGSSSSAPSDTSGSVVQVCFPSARTSMLDSLNRQREDGRLCDLSIHVQGHVFKAHRCVLAASSPYFHDQVLLKNMSTVSIPAVMDPLAFESVLSCAYTGQLQMLREDIVNYLTVGSVLQMWHIVDKCTELLKEGRAGGGSSGGGGVQDGASAGGGGGSANLGCSSSNGDGGAGGGNSAGSDGGAGGGQAQVVGSNEPQRASQPPSRPSVSESQSPSSTNYFSPRDGSSFGGSCAAAAGASVDGGGASNTPGYCTPSGGEEAFLIEEEEEEVEEEEEEVLYHQRKRGRGGSGRRKKISSVSEQEVGVSDSFGVSSYQDGENSALTPQKRPTYSQPSIMPRKQWVVVKTERMEDDDLIVVSGEEGEDEEDEEDRELELARERARSDFNISNVRSLSAELGGRAENDMDSQVDYCQSSEDYLKFEGSLMDQTLAQHLHDSAAGQSQSANRAVSALLGQVQSAATARAQLFPLDMQGNQILLYSQASGLSLDTAAAPLGMAGGMIGGASFKGPSLEHGAVHLSVQGGLGVDGMDSGGIGSGNGGSNSSSGGSGKVFMCHCGKTFTHKSMRDRHINMHLDLRPFHCPVCAKKFKMKHHLTEHMKTHTGLKPYDCLGCGKKFMWRDSFMRHRSHCERRSGLGDSGEGGSSRDGGRRGDGGEDGPDLISSPHLLLSAGEGSILGGGGGGGGRGGVSVSSPHLSGAVLSPQHVGVSATGSNSGNSVSNSGSSAMSNMAAAGALLGVVSQSPGQGSGMFSGLGLGRSVCDEDVCEVGANDSSVT
ncbi:zinc finger and BTB domain-containing protein 22b isoform X1 [Micropterus dolomieu]|uniref:zinc finger and BTB domain-containing protein 22b isoform X1 n=2 Tax=Micropterus dolomieu TaxID=147949 RepID=UPI001E8E23A7|nr:zinc finger and BTB domain-containing protein 22b isoform X1 [Micropterus dolomieu]